MGKTKAQQSAELLDAIVGHKTTKNEDLDMNGYSIKNLPTPVDNDDPATKQYVADVIGVAFFDETLIFIGEIDGINGGVTSQPWADFRQIIITGTTGTNINNELIVDTRSLNSAGDLLLGFYDGGIRIGQMVFSGTNNWFTSNNLGTNVSILGIGRK